jgi:hypothetical protein
MMMEGILLGVWLGLTIGTYVDHWLFRDGNWQRAHQNVISYAFALGVAYAALVMRPFLLPMMR